MSDGIPPPPPPPPPPVVPPPPPPPPPPLPPGGSQQNLLSSNGKSVSKTKYRRLLWKKIPDNQIHNAENIWSKNQHPEQATKLKPDFEIIHELFSVKESSKKMPSRRSPSPRPLGEAGGHGKTTLLDSQRSLNVNIYLRQFKKSISEVLKAIEECDTSFMSGEQLQSLLKLLPEGEEKKTIIGFNDDPSMLDNADKFLVGMQAIPSYTLRIECTLMRNTFTTTITQIEESLKYLHLAMKEIRECRALPAILHLVLQAGNYLNQGLSYGNASGFRLQSLRVLVDTKANTPGITMMHYVAMELEKQNESMMNWPDQLPTLSKACKISDKEVYAELTTLTKDVIALRNRIEKDDGLDLKEKMSNFMEMSEEHLKLVDEKKSKLTEYTKEFALYLCEQPRQFSLEECFSTVAEFQDKFEKASRDNIRKDKLKAKRERNRNLSSRSFSGISQETAVATDTKSATKRRNTINILHQNESVRALRCMSESCIEEESSNVPVISHTRSRSDKLDVKVTRVTLTKLDPLRRNDTHNNGQENSSNMEQKGPKMAWSNEQDGKSRTDSGFNDSTSSLAEALNRESTYGRKRREDYLRPTTQRRFRSLRAGLWESETDFGNAGLRDRREISQSVESLGGLPTENRREITSSTDLDTTGNAESNDENSTSRERFLLRRAFARSSTDLGLSPDTYVTNSGEILKMSESETKQRPKSMDATTERNWNTNLDDQQRNRNEDIREKIRRYRESIKEIDESSSPVLRQSLSERRRSSSSSSRSSIAKEDSSVSRLTRKFEPRLSETKGYENICSEEKVSKVSDESSLVLIDIAREDSIDDTTAQSNGVNSERTSSSDNVISRDGVIKHDSTESHAANRTNIQIKVTQHTDDNRKQQVRQIKDKCEKPESNTVKSQQDAESKSDSQVGISDISYGTNSVFEDTTADISACTDLGEIDNHHFVPTEATQTEAPPRDHENLNNVDNDDTRSEISVPFIDEDEIDDPDMKASIIDQSVIAELSEEIKVMNNKLKSKRTALSEVTKAATNRSHNPQKMHSTKVTPKPKTVSTVKVVTKTKITVHETFTSSSLPRGSKGPPSTVSRAKSYAEQIKQRASIRKSEAVETTDKSTPRVGMLTKSRRTLSSTSLNENKQTTKTVPTAAKPNENSTVDGKPETSSIKRTINSINRLSTPKSASARADAVRRSMRASNDQLPSSRNQLKKSTSLQDVRRKSAIVSKDQASRNIVPKNSAKIVATGNYAGNKPASSAPSSARGKSDKIVSPISKEKPLKPSILERTQIQPRRVDSKSMSSIHTPRSRSTVNVRANMAAMPTGRISDSPRKSSSPFQSTSMIKQNSKETKRDNIAKYKTENKPKDRPRTSSASKSAFNQSIYGTKELISTPKTKKTPAVVNASADDGKKKNEKLSTPSNNKCKITSKASVTRDSKSSVQGPKPGSLSARSSTRKGPLAPSSNNNTPRSKTPIVRKLQDQRSLSSSDLSRKRWTSSEEIAKPFVPLKSSISSRSTSSLAMKSKPKVSAAKPQVIYLNKATRLRMQKNTKG